jgi:hypothetical protein
VGGDIDGGRGGGACLWASTTWAVSRRMGKAAPSSAARAGMGDKVPLVSTMERAF